MTVGALEVLHAVRVGRERTRTPETALLRAQEPEELDVLEDVRLVGTDAAAPVGFATS